MQDSGPQGKLPTPEDKDETVKNVKMQKMSMPQF